MPPSVVARYFLHYSEIYAVARLVHVQVDRSRIFVETRLVLVFSVAPVEQTNDNTRRSDLSGFECEYGAR
jgi:hypothetical protein